MSNYPAGVEYDSNAPFNKPSIEPENENLFDFIIDNALNKDSEEVKLLKEHETVLIKAKQIINDMIYICESTDSGNILMLRQLKKLISIPEIQI